jgi:hypothetical protein
VTLRVIEGYDWIPAGHNTFNYLLAADDYYWVGTTFPWATIAGAFGGSALGIGGDIFPPSQKAPACLLTGVSVQSGTIGCRVYRGSSDTCDPTICVFDTTNNLAQISFSFSYFGVIKVWRGAPWAGGVVIAQTPAGAYFMDNTFYFEASWTIDPAVGSVVAKVNAGVPAHLTGVVINLPTANTQGSSVNTSDSVAIGYYCYSGGTVLASGPNFDDLYMVDTAGSVNTAFLGNVRVQLLQTSGAGAHTGLSIGGSSPAATNWQSVQNWQLNDAQYVYTPTTGVYDLYTVSPMVNTGTVFGVQVRGAMRQDDATEIEGQNLIYSSGVQGTTTPRLLSETYAFYKDILEADPNTGTGWLAAAVNAAQIGILKAA